MKTFVSKIIISVLPAVLIAAIVFAWTEPSQNPPLGNTLAPLNVSGTAQTKTGELTFPKMVDYDDNGYYVDPHANSWLYRIYSYDIRSDIYRDRDNTTFYLDPAGTSVLNDLTVNGQSVCLANGTNCPAGSSYWFSSGTNIYNTNSGNVGIGTTGPDSKLHIEGSGTDILRVKSTGASANILVSTSAGQQTEMVSGSTGFYFNVPVAGHNINFYTQGAPTQGIFIKAGGNVGIGTTGPGKLLDVAGTIRSFGNTDVNRLQLLNAAKTAGVSLTYDTTNDGLSIDNDVFVTSGNLGIGTTGPVGKLQVRGGRLIVDANTVISLSGAADDNWAIRQNSSCSVGSQTNCIDIIAGVNNGGIRFMDQPDVAMVIDTSTGRVGIGTTNPGQKLHVTGYVRGDSGLCMGTDCKTSWPSISESDTLQTVTDRGRSTSQWIQSPRFEDIDNAGYYIDPAGTSNVNRMYVNYSPTAPNDAATKGYVDAQVGGAAAGRKMLYSALAGYNDGYNTIGWDTAYMIGMTDKINEYINVASVPVYIPSGITTIYARVFGVFSTTGVSGAREARFILCSATCSGYWATISNRASWSGDLSIPNPGSGIQPISIQAGHFSGGWPDAAGLYGFIIWGE